MVIKIQNGLKLLFFSPTGIKPKSFLNKMLIVNNKNRVETFKENYRHFITGPVTSSSGNSFADVSI